MSDLPARTRDDHAGQILLTGATGFFGAFLLDELLIKTERTVNCLVRAAGKEQASRRVRENLTHYGRWNDAVADRIAATQGDLSLPYLGLPPAEFEDLAAKTTAIFHNGALVNYLFPLPRMRSVNVDGTLSLIKLATMSSIPKELHYVSMAGQDPISAYGQSKLEAEGMVRQAAANGVPASIFKISRLAPDSRTGLWNKSDILIRLLDIVLQVGVAPCMEFSEDWVAVDVAARAIVRTAMTSRSRQAFSLSPRELTSFRYLLEVARENGFRIEVDSLANWTKRVRATGTPEYELTIRALRFDEATDRFDEAPGIASMSDETGPDGFRHSVLDVPGVDRAALDSFFARWRMHDHAAGRKSGRPVRPGRR